MEYADVLLWLIGVRYVSRYRGGVRKLTFWQKANIMSKSKCRIIKGGDLNS